MDMRLGNIFSMLQMYGMVLTNHNILNRISNVRLIIIFSEEKKPTQR